ncbi:neuronal acetylcholine receptor subunit alpha-10-like [Lytechinus pictus]|uniref:neuronal acetylcholine receptor subunit alpha-10-like n=1 Tax=Lytechinus pictus TaxID=7653 RepID=UPI00240E727C|nr:neuronal acetylcholine receptor subunit alpha-10-like [Lytechinus pictus]
MKMDVFRLRCVLLISAIIFGFTLKVSDAEMMMTMSNSTRTTRPSFNTETRLIRNLLSQYSRYVRPVFNESTIIYVYYHMRLSRILQMDERNQILITAMWLEQSWIDEYLTWNPDEYDNITAVHIPTTMIWIPDTVLYESADVEKELGNDVMLTNAKIFYNGTVFWQAPAIFKSSCSLSVEYFPFDQHSCKLKFGPWAYLGNEVIMKKQSDSGDFSQLSPNGQWQLQGMPVVENLIKYGCCPIPYSDVTYYINLKRKSLFYVFNLLFPSVFMSLVSLLSFYLPPDSGEKVGLNITSLLSLVFFLLLGAQLLPPTSESISYLGKLFSTIIAIMGIETAISVIILRLYHLHLPYPPPAWARWLILDKAAQLLRLNGWRHEYIDDEGSMLEVIDHDAQDHKTSDPFEFDNRKTSMETKAIGESLLQKLDMSPEDVAVPEIKEKHSSEDSDYGSETNDDSMGSSIMRISNYIRRLVNISRKKEALSAIQQQWIDLCLILDRVLLILMMTALFLGCISILSIMSNPASQEEFEIW